MKKSLLVWVMVVGSCVLAMGQTITRRVGITVSTVTGQSARVTLMEGPSFSPAFDNGYDAEAISTGDTTAFELYVIYGDGNMYMTYATDTLNGTRIGFKSNNSDTEYVLSFSNVTGGDVYMYDSDMQAYISSISEQGYTFSCMTGTSYNERFVLIDPNAQGGDDPTNNNDSIWEPQTITGMCGDSVMWQLFVGDEDVTLVLDGTGAMYSYSQDSLAPWASYTGLIQSVAVSDGITNIGNYAFYNCTAATMAYIGSTVTQIGSYAFGNCSSLETINCYGVHPPTLASTAFYYSSYKDFVVYVPAEALDDYKSDKYWSQYNLEGVESDDDVPSDAVLANYYNEGQVCVCIYVPEEIACGDIVLTGSFNEWSSTVANCPRFAAIQGYEGWYVAAFNPESDPDAGEGIKAKPVMLDPDGNFNWEYQIGAATVVRGGVQVIQGTSAGEIDLITYGTDAPNVYTVDAWKQNSCTAVYHNYTITVISDGCDGKAVPYLTGTMTGWDFQQMELDTTKTLEYNAPTYSISFRTAEDSPYQIVSGLLSESGEIEEMPAWNEDSYLQKLVGDEWVRIPGEEADNLLTHKDANILWDLRSDTLRWARCDDSAVEYTIFAVNLPTANCPEKIEVVGTFDNWEGTALEQLESGWWFAELNVKASHYFKIRSAGSWEKELEVYDAENAQWKLIEDGQFKFGELWSDDSWKGEPCKWVELDFSDPDKYRWTGDSVAPSSPQLWPIAMNDYKFREVSEYVIADFRPKTNGNELYIWDSTYVPVESSSSDVDFYGRTSQTGENLYLKLQVGDQGWAGMGYTAQYEQVKSLKDAMLDSDEEYYLHFAIKSTDNAWHTFYPFNEQRAGIGFDKSYKGTKLGISRYCLLEDFARDGEWHEYYVPLSIFLDMATENDTALIYGYVLSAMSEGIEGAELNLDAVYYCNSAMKQRLSPNYTDEWNISIMEYDVLEESVVTILGQEIDPSQMDTTGVVDIYGDSTLVYNPEENTLTINNLTLTVGEDESTAISYTGEEPLTIVLNDSSTIFADTVISSTADIIIEGDGYLVAEAVVPIIGAPTATITFRSVNMSVKSLPASSSVRRRIRGGKRLDETGGPALSGFASADMGKNTITPPDAEYGEVELSESAGPGQGGKTVNALYVVNANGNRQAVTEFTLTAIPEDENAVEETKEYKALDPSKPMYNILGVQVGADYKGIVIQDGNTYLR